MDRSQQKQKPWFVGAAINGIVLLIALGVGIALFEIGVRGLGLEVNISPNWNYHPVLGWSQVPNGDYEFDYEGEPIHIRFNSLGFRDVEHEIAKPPGVRRIVVIGDSFSEAVQVNFQEIYFKRLEEMLNARRPEKWEVINLGVGDFGTAQQWLALAEYGVEYQPDIVLHQIFPLNDICTNSIDLYGLCKSDNDRYRPYFVENARGLKIVYKQPVRSFLRKYFISFGLVERLILQRQGKPRYHADYEYRKQYLSEIGFPPLELLLYTYVADRDQLQQIADGWRVTEKGLEKINSLCQEIGARYLPVVLPFEGRLDTVWQRIAPLIHQEPPLDRYYPEKRLGGFFTKNGVEPVLMRDLLQENEDEVLPFRDGHFNPAAHRLTAEAIYDLLYSGRAGEVSQ